MEDEHTNQYICNYIEDMLSNLIITLDHVHVNLREIAKNNKKYKKRNALLCVEEVDTKWILTYLIVEILSNVFNRA